MLERKSEVFACIMLIISILITGFMLRSLISSNINPYLILAILLLCFTMIWITLISALSFWISIKNEKRIKNEDK